MNDISTAILVRELDKRLGDWVHDPEPQYDAFFSDLNPIHAEALERALRSAIRIHAHKVVERVAEQMKEDA